MFSRSRKVTPSALLPATAYVTDTLVARPTEYCVSQFCGMDMSHPLTHRPRSTYPLITWKAWVRNSVNGQRRIRPVLDVGPALSQKRLRRQDCQPNIGSPDHCPPTCRSLGFALSPPRPLTYKLLSGEIAGVAGMW